MPAKLNLMSDSTCDIPADEALRLGVSLVPFTYSEAARPDGGLSGTDDQFQARSAHEFYDAMRAGAAPMTSQPSQLAYEEALERAVGTGLPSVLFCISGALSGSREGALAALGRVRERLGDGIPPVHVVDSGLAASSQYLLVERAARMRDEGATAEEVVEWAADATYRVQTLCMLDGLDALRRGGRVPASVAKAAGALGVKPLINFATDGSLKMAGVVHGRAKGKKRLAAYYANRRVEPTVAIGDADCPDEAEALAELIRKVDPDVRVMRCSIGPTIGSHVGPGALVCSFWGADRRR